MRLEVNPQHPEPRKIQRAAQLLEQGEVIVYPTDTVYGIGCGLAHKRAVDRIYHLTGKDERHPLTLVCADLSGIALFEEAFYHGQRAVAEVLTAETLRRRV